MRRNLNDLLTVLEAARKNEQGPLIKPSKQFFGLRLRTETVRDLECLAEHLHLAKTTVAQELLEQAIADAVSFYGLSASDVPSPEL